MLHLKGAESFLETSECTLRTQQRVSGRDEHGSGLDRTGSGLKPILAGSGLDRTAIFLKIGGQDWIGMRKFLLFCCDYSNPVVLKLLYAYH